MLHTITIIRLIPNSALNASGLKEVVVVQASLKRTPRPVPHRESVWRNRSPVVASRSATLRARRRGPSSDCCWISPDRWRSGWTRWPRRGRRRSCCCVGRGASGWACPSGTPRGRRWGRSRPAWARPSWTDPGNCRRSVSSESWKTSRETPGCWGSGSCCWKSAWLPFSQCEASTCPRGSLGGPQWSLGHCKAHSCKKEIIRHIIIYRKDSQIEWVWGREFDNMHDVYTILI